MRPDFRGSEYDPGWSMPEFRRWRQAYLNDAPEELLRRLDEAAIAAGEYSRRFGSVLSAADVLKRAITAGTRRGAPAVAEPKRVHDNRRLRGVMSSRFCCLRRQRFGPIQSVIQERSDGRRLVPGVLLSRDALHPLI